jgi:phosphodiesterase/alkaline phosphatase D-like protein
MSRPFRALAVTFGVGALLLTATPAMAAKIHAFTTTFGAAGSTPANPYPLSNPTDAAVDNSTGGSKGDVYVTDPINHRVEKFDPSGNFVLMFGKDVDQTTGGNVCTALSGHTCQAGRSGSGPGEFEVPNFVAVDGSSGVSAGDVYIGDTGGEAVSKFDSSGNLISSWGTGGQLSGISPLNGIAADPSGNLFILSEPTASWYEQDGTFHSTFAYPRGTYPAGLAVDAEDHLYKADGEPQVTKFTNTGENLGEPDTRNDAAGLTVDTSSNDLFVVQRGEGGFVNRYALNCGQACAPVESFGTGNLSGPMGIAIDGSSGTVYVANSTAGSVAAFAQGIIVDLSTGESSNVGLSSATLSGHLDPAGGGAVTSCHFEYGTTTAYDLGSVPCSPGPPYSSPIDVNTELSGLTSDTTYHYRLVASNSFGPTFGRDKTFETLHAVPGLTTESATGITSSTAALHGAFTGNGEDTHYYFQWGLSTSYNNSFPLPPGNDITSPLGDTVVTPVILTNLNQDSTYYYRIVASNAAGTSLGQGQTLKTLRAPAVTPLAATNFSQTAVTVNAKINPRESGPTSYRVEYGPASCSLQPDPCLSTPDSSPIPSDELEHQVVVELTALSPGTTFHYRILATSPSGTTAESDQTFTTLPLAPSVNAISVLGITKSDATLEAQINPGFGYTVYLFEYGLTATYGHSTLVSSPLPADGADHAATAEVGGLTPDTTYHYRVVAINFLGTTSSPDHTFITSAPPAVLASSASGLSPTSATLSAQIDPHLAPTTYHFEYGTDESYGHITPESGALGIDGVAHFVSAAIGGLSPATAYHFRAVAKSPEGQSFGSDQVFTTPPSEEVRASARPKCTKGRVRRHGKCVKRPPGKHKRQPNHG